MAISRRPDGTLLPGSRANPDGRNQYTYRREAELQLDRMLKAAIENGELSVSETIIAGLLQEAVNRQPWALGMVLDRMLPKVEKHEHVVDDTAELSSLLARLAGFASARRTNGHDREADTSGTPGSNGSGV